MDKLRRAKTKLHHHWDRADKRRVLWLAGGLLLIVIWAVQFAYPNDRLLPFTRIDGRAFGGASMNQATQQLNSAYANHKVAIFMGSGTKPVTSPKLSAADITVDNTTRVEKLGYPWYLRIVPTSILWAGLKKSAAPVPRFGDNFDDYVDKNLMPSCRENPVNASLRASGDKLELVKAKKGGECEKSDVTKSLKTIRPQLTSDTTVRVNRKEIDAPIGDAAALSLRDTLVTRLSGGVPMAVGGETVTIGAKDVYSWLDFGERDGKLAATLNAERTSAWLNAPIAGKLSVKPGVSYITTRDFTVVSQTTGASGQALDVGPTIQSLQTVVDGGAARASAVTKVIPPTEQYTRTYSPSDAGLSALMANFAKDHPGTFGVSMVELDGKKRRADFRGNEQFVTASTYKLFVAYSLLKQIDAGKRDWDSNAACFNKMISLSDNACAESFLSSLGLKTVTDDIQAIGLKNSTFMKSGGPFTTANDLTLELGMIATGQNFSGANQQRLIAAMKANVYRKGIPAGVQGTVADKVGFMDGLLHDAAIVYGPNGTYVLAIMSDGSSWATIADLAKQIDTLRAQ